MSSCGPSHSIMRTKDGGCFAGLPPGRTDLTLQIHPFAPMKLDAVEILGGRDTDLGVLRLLQPGRLRIAIERVALPADCDLEVELTTKLGSYLDVHEDVAAKA